MAAAGWFDNELEVAEFNKSLLSAVICWMSSQ